MSGFQHIYEFPELAEVLVRVHWDGNVDGLRPGGASRGRSAAPCHPGVTADVDLIQRDDPFVAGNLCAKVGVRYL